MAKRRWRHSDSGLLLPDTRLVDPFRPRGALDSRRYVRRSPRCGVCCAQRCYTWFSTEFTAIADEADLSLYSWTSQYGEWHVAGGRLLCSTTPGPNVITHGIGIGNEYDFSDNLRYEILTENLGDSWPGIVWDCEFDEGGGLYAYRVAMIDNEWVDPTTLEQTTDFQLVVYDYGAFGNRTKVDAIRLTQNEELLAKGWLAFQVSRETSHEHGWIYVWTVGWAPDTGVGDEVPQMTIGLRGYQIDEPRMIGGAFCLQANDGDTVAFKGFSETLARSEEHTNCPGVPLCNGFDHAIPEELHLGVEHVAAADGACSPFGWADGHDPDNLNGSFVLRRVPQEDLLGPDELGCFFYVELPADVHCANPTSPVAKGYGLWYNGGCNGCNAATDGDWQLISTDAVNVYAWAMNLASIMLQVATIARGGVWDNDPMTTTPGLPANLHGIDWRNAVFHLTEL